ncbi:MAG: efflux RND transporter periplasmic adaptor subunit [Thermodesulfobacteriota bacterium]|jgi:membrane fusion protein (multidrug efflux system)|nr:MAG: efflux RND transporter periplasmic adaptor subunit [Thermodesulfobacteriota bacterium]
MKSFSILRSSFLFVFLISYCLVFFLFPGCKKADVSQARPPAQVSVIKIELKDMPVSLEFVGQTQSSHQVEIRARVNGFLDERTYVEGTLVHDGDVMFRMDPKPYQAQLQAAQGELAQQQARLTTARANLARVKPLVEQDALSQKDLDDATGQEQTAAAAVESAKANVEETKLNLGYTTIITPVTGLSSYARVQDGAYVNQSNSLLTYVSQIDPIWVTFSLSENDVLKSRSEAERGQLVLPKEDAYEVEVELGDGSIFPERGRITFADAEYNQQTGTFLLRATLPNPKGHLRPGQFVRVHILGVIRPKAILVPLRAVQQGDKGHFIWVVNKEGKAEQRPVVVGDWMGNNWFINEGLIAGDQVVVDGGLTLRPGDPVTVKSQMSTVESAPGSAVLKADAGKTEPTMSQK